MEVRETAAGLTTYLEDRHERNRRDIANALRRLADDVDEADVRVGLSNLRPCYGAQAAKIVSIVTWGVANLGISQFAADAAELDVALAEEASNAAS